MMAVIDGEKVVLVGVLVGATSFKLVLWQFMAVILDRIWLAYDRWRPKSLVVVLAKNKGSWFYSNSHQRLTVFGLFTRWLHD